MSKRVYIGTAFSVWETPKGKFFARSGVLESPFLATKELAINWGKLIFR
jgi:hypothetical protein